MDIFGNEDTRTEYEKKIDKELDELLKAYKDRFNENLNTESFIMSAEQLIKDLKLCLKKGITLDVIYPDINDYDEDIML